MTATLQLCANPLDQLQATALAPHAGIYEGYLSERGYAPSTQGGYLRCLVHFGRWMSQCGLNAEDLDEEVVAQFLDEHLPHCRCPAPVVHTREDLQAALGHLLVVLLANAVIPERVSATTPVDEELSRFDVHMDQVRGLAATTRRFYRHIIRCFLLQQFGDDHVDLAAIKPEAVRRFITDQSAHYSSPGGVATLIAALRGYFRFRNACGDHMQALSAVLIAQGIDTQHQRRNHRASGGGPQPWTREHPDPNALFVRDHLRHAYRPRFKALPHGDPNTPPSRLQHTQALEDHRDPAASPSAVPWASQASTASHDAAAGRRLRANLNWPMVSARAGYPFHPREHRLG